VALFNESNQARFSLGIARLHDIKGNPAPQVAPELAHGIELEQGNFATELDALVGRRNAYTAVSLPAVGVGISSGLVLSLSQFGILVVVTGIQVNKPTAGNVFVGLSDTGAFPGTFAASFGFYRDSRWGPVLSTKPAVPVLTHATGGVPVTGGFKRVAVQAGVFTDVLFKPALVLLRLPTNPAAVQFGVFNETLNETMDVMIDWYERAASPSEIILAQ